MFFQKLEFETQTLPSSLRYLEKHLSIFFVKKIFGNIEGFHAPSTIIQQTNGMVRFKILFYKVNRDEKPNLEELKLFFLLKFPSMTSKERYAFECLLLNRWLSQDWTRLEKLMKMDNVFEIIKFVDNLIFERGYDDYFPIGVHMSIMCTTGFIQSGLDYKHAGNMDGGLGGRGWNHPGLEKYFRGCNSLADIIRGYNCPIQCIILEVIPGIGKLMVDAGFVVIDNLNRENLKAVIVNKISIEEILVRIKPLLDAKQVNFLFSTSMKDFLDRPNLYLLNAIRFIYYCITDRFQPRGADRTILFITSILARLQYLHGGSLSTFTLASSPEIFPLSLGSRRLPSLKKASLGGRVYENDIDSRGEMIRGEMITGGIHNPSIRVSFNSSIAIPGEDLPFSITTPNEAVKGITRAEIYAISRELINQRKIKGIYKINSRKEFFELIRLSGAIVYRGERSFSIDSQLDQIRNLL